jgi:chromosomal replication initiator protein
MRQRRREPHWSLTTLATESNPGPDGHGSNTGITLSELDNIWNRIRSDLRGAVSDSTFQVWIDPLKPALLEDGVLVVEAPDSIRRWVESRFGDVLQRTAESVRGTATRVELTAPGKVRPLGHTDPRGEAESGLSAGESNPTLSLNPKLCFDQFVIGQGNRLAHASALAVAEMPSQTYNPLFIYGDVGLGKTHLMNAIGLKIQEKYPNLRVHYTTFEKFMNHMIESIRFEKMEEFRDRYRKNVDVLIVDDIQFIAGKEATQEEFFHTFNALYELQKQIVISSDRPPTEIEKLEDRLKSRFEMGLTVDIQAPEMETRVAIVFKKAEMDGIDLPNDVAFHLAKMYRSNIRELEGALIKLSA